MSALPVSTCCAASAALRQVANVLSVSDRLMCEAQEMLEDDAVQLYDIKLGLPVGDAEVEAGEDGGDLAGLCRHKVGACAGDGKEGYLL